MNDYNYDYNPNPEPLDPEPAHSGMETAAIILGILALVGSTCFYLSIPCAAVGILLALLSRGRKEHMSNRAKTGLCISAAGLAGCCRSLYKMLHPTYFSVFRAHRWPRKLRFSYKNSPVD